MQTFRDGTNDLRVDPVLVSIDQARSAIAQNKYRTLETLIYIYIWKPDRSIGQMTDKHEYMYVFDYESCLSKMKNF